MPEIDHFFVFASGGAPERARFAAAGIGVAAEREHAGQGTRNVCFAFGEDRYLELLWLADEQAARSAMVKPLGLDERMRWREHSASPFGVAFRPRGPDDELPLATWDYAPEFAADRPLRMGCNSGVLGEPLVFGVPMPTGTASGAGLAPTPHPLRTRRLAQLRIHTPELAPMSLLRHVHIDRLQFVDGPEHLMEVEFEARTGHELDLRPELPLVLRW